ncbi:TPA: hypothetical protein ACH3X1_002736 [Trebouxia sp. C0004]
MVGHEIIAKPRQNASCWQCRERGLGHTGKKAADLAAAGSVTATSADHSGQASGAGGSGGNLSGSVEAVHPCPVRPGSQKATHQGVIQPGSQGIPAAAASHEVLPTAANSSMTGPAMSSLAQKHLKPGVKSFKFKVPAAKRGTPLPSPSQQQHPAASNRSSASGVSKAAPQHTLAAPPAGHSQSKAGVQSSQPHSRSRAQSGKPAPQKQAPAAAAAAWKTQSHSAAQHATSRTALLPSGAAAPAAQPSQPGEGASGPMFYARAAGKGVPEEQDRLLVIDNLVFPYMPREKDSAEDKQAKKQVLDNLTDLATGRHRMRSCRHIAGTLH